MIDPKKPRALTYTEMMNGGRQQIDGAEQNKKVDVEQRREDLELKVEHSKKSLHE